MYLKKLLVRLEFFKTNLRLRKIPRNVYWGSFSEKQSSISDGFLWRTDNGFETRLRFSDIIGAFFEEKNSFVFIEIYSKDNKLIKNFCVKNLKVVNEFIINDKIIGARDYGTFYVFHGLNKKINFKNSILNRCYVGYFKNQAGSFVHGNSIVSGKEINGNKKQKNFVNKSFWLDQKYIIQNSFSEFEKTELFFVNPVTKIITLKIRDKKYNIEGLSILKIELKKIDIIEIISNCRFLRPLIFTYKESYFDCYHS